MTRISVAKDFSKYPAGRNESDGPYSGEGFRKKHLLPALDASAGKITIHLDGCMGLSSGFIDEAFGALVRVDGFTPELLRERLHFTGSIDWLETEGEIWDSVEANRKGEAPQTLKREIARLLNSAQPIRFEDISDLERKVDEIKAAYPTADECDLIYVDTLVSFTLDEVRS